MKAHRYWSLAVLAVCVSAALIFRRFAFVAWYPVGMSAFLSIAFGLSLLGERPLCLVFAEALPPHLLPEGAESYCRRLTAIWCLALLANGLVATATVFAPRWVWFAWNCALSYGVLGSLLLGERIVRRRVFATTFHTSGSTATPKTIVKTFDTLAAEAVFHREVTVSAALAERPVFLSTIEPEHLYGLLWRVLLPKAAKCVVDPEVILTPESLLAKMRAAKGVFLVTTPSFLERFCAYSDQYDVPQNVVEIITSGALLTADVSAAAHRVFGRAPLEIFGSTETGGVAWRRQGGAPVPDGLDWTVFAPVRVSATDGRLVVDSPFSCSKGFAMGDGVVLSPDHRRFRLLGRLDRMVKIAEQRVSLPEMEEKMATVAGVRSAALVKLDGPHGPYLGAVVVPDLTGQPPQTLRKRILALELRKRLLPMFPKGTAPRKYRFVHELPRNAQGKVRASALARLFGTAWGEPFVLEARRLADGWEADLVFDPDAVYFQGHFPGFPLLAGVVELGVAHHFAEALLGRALVLKTVRKMKFSGMVHPGEVVRLSLKCASPGSVSYRYQKQEAICASGVMEF